MYHYFIVLNYALWLVRMNYAASWVGALPMITIVVGLVSAYVYDSWRARIAGYVLGLVCVGAELLGGSGGRLEAELFAWSLGASLGVQSYEIHKVRGMASAFDAPTV